MSSQRRIDPSPANGAKSRGPVTPGLTRGLTSDLVVLSYESEAEFNTLRGEYLADYQPQTRSQFDLVDHLVATRWRLNRVLSLQSSLMDIQMARQQPEIDKEFGSCDGETRAAIAFQRLCDDSRGLESLNRHETRLSAELRRTMKLLDAQLKNQKFHHEPSSENGHPAPQSNQEDPAGESPRIPPAGSTGDEQRAPSGAPLARPKLHDEPNRAKPPHFDEDRPAEKAPPIASTIGHLPSTIDPLQAAGDERSTIRRDVISASAIAGPSAKADLFLNSAPMSRR